MNRIPVGQYLYIENGDHWRMVAPASVTRSADIAVLEAAPGGPFRYIDAFGVSRRLPTKGHLTTEQIQRVVVGWSRRDEAWHLGLMLTPEAALARSGIRWVEIAAWRTLEAKQTVVDLGEALARTLALPFSIVPPKDDSSIIVPVLPQPQTAPVEAPVPAPVYAPPAVPAPAAVFPSAAPPPPTAAAPAFSGVGAAAPIFPTDIPHAQPVVAPVAPEPLLREPPFEIDAWTFTRLSPHVLELRLNRSLGRRALLRALWYVFWAAIFFLLSAASLTSGIAPPQPEFLIYAGFIAGAYLIIAAFVTLFRSGRQINRIVADAVRREIVGLRGDVARWVLPADTIHALYISERVSRVRPGKPGRLIHDGELNFLMHDGKFWHGAVFNNLDERVTLSLPPVTQADADALNRAEVVPLDGHRALSSLSQAGLLIARMMGIAASYDQRLKG
jgi:hypothetical protein